MSRHNSRRNETYETLDNPSMIFPFNKRFNFTFTKLCVRLCGVLLLILALAKITNGVNETVDRITATDPVFGLKISHVFLLVGGIEIIVGLTCLFARRPAMAAAFLAWFSTNLVLYRAGILWIDSGRPCQCMAGLSTYLGLTPQAADQIMLWVLSILIIIGYAFSLREHKKILCRFRWSGFKSEHP